MSLPLAIHPFLFFLVLYHFQAPNTTLSTNLQLLMQPLLCMKKAPFMFSCLAFFLPGTLSQLHSPMLHFHAPLLAVLIPTAIPCLPTALITVALLHFQSCPYYGFESTCCQLYTFAPYQYTSCLCYTPIHSCYTSSTPYAYVDCFHSLYFWPFQP